MASSLRALSTNHAYHARILPSIVSTGMDTVTGRYKLGSLTAGLVNSSLNAKPEELAALRTKLFQNPQNRPVKIPSTDGVTLDGVLVKAGQARAKGVVFFVLGSGGTYEKLADEKDLAQAMVHFFQQDVGNVDILVINPRGIGESKGAPTLTGWEHDIHSGLTHLLKEGYAPENIMLYGHSFGSWISRAPLRVINKQLKTEGKQTIPETHDRTYSDFPTEVYHYLGMGLKGNAGYLLAHAGKWSNYQAPQYDKDSKVLAIWSPQDETVNKMASFVHDLQARGIIVRTIEIAKDRPEIHAREFTADEKRSVATAMKEMMQLTVHNAARGVLK